VTLPGIYLGILVSTGLSLVFHLIRGGALGRLVLYLMTGWLAFFLGHFIGEWLDWRLLRLGPINMFPAVLAALTGLLAASVLVGPEAKSRRRKGRKRGPKG
jgi:predicted MFS family arabinose efflux permease